MKEGEGAGEGSFLSCFLPHPLPALSLAPFFARSLTLVPRSLLLNRTETLATQATNPYASGKTQFANTSIRRTPSGGPYSLSIHSIVTILWTHLSEGPQALETVNG